MEERTKEIIMFERTNQVTINGHSFDVGKLEVGEDYCYTLSDTGITINQELEDADGGFRYGVIDLRGFHYHEGDLHCIYPGSVWNKKHRPKCDPRGMYYEPSCNIWIDIDPTPATMSEMTLDPKGKIPMSDLLKDSSGSPLSDEEFMALPEGRKWSDTPSPGRKRTVSYQDFK